MATMARDNQNIVILGAGITGLTAAWKLSETYPGSVVLLEKEPAAGGLAATFRREDFSFDIGSHRLHEGYDPAVAQLVHEICGDELLRRERRGLILVKNRFLRYPPSAFDILFAFGAGDLLRFTRDFIAARLAAALSSGEPDNFEDFTIRSVGKSLYERFYKPYAFKLYKLPPHKISKEPALSRVRKFAISTIFQDLIKKLTKAQSSFYYYPARGIGHLSEALQQRFLANRGKMILLSNIEKIQLNDKRSVEAVVFKTQDGNRVRLETAVLISTVPLDVLHGLITLESDGCESPRFDLRWRSLRLLYLITRDKIPSEYETFYFPEPNILFGRVSEVNKYSPFLNANPDYTALTIEIPCSYEDEIWNMDDAMLAERCIEQLQALKILNTPAVGEFDFFSKRVKTVYPVYDLGWRRRFDRLYQRLNVLENLYMIGRSALFLHCNIDHCMLMAIRLAQHLSEAHPTKEAWAATEKDFFNYRVRE